MRSLKNIAIIFSVGFVVFLTRDKVEFKAKGWVRSVPPQVTKRILIVSYWRSGSTFVGALIQSHPGVFYFYEPLHYLASFGRIETPEQNEFSVQLLSQLSDCEMPSYYFNYTVDEGFGNPTFFLSANSQALDYCKSNASLCKSADLYGKLCAKFPVQLMKIVRLPLVTTRQLVKELAGTDLKIIHLIRDPRGIMASRMDKLFCIYPSCNDPAELCKQMRQDIKEFNLLKKQYPQMFYQLKFEDLSSNVLKETEKLFEFLGLNVAGSVIDFITSHTNSSDKQQQEDPFSTVRDSKTVSSAWKKVLNKTAISSITDTCLDVLKEFNYEH